MKYRIVTLLFAAFLFSCADKKNKVILPTKADTSGVIEALYVTNGNTLALTGGPVKRVIVPVNGQRIDSTTEPGKMLVVDFKGVDTFYLLPNVDSTLLMLDSLKRPLLDKDGKRQYFTSFKNALHLSKSYLSETPIHFNQVK